MGSLTAAGAERRSSEYQQQQQQQQQPLNQTPNHNNRDNNCQISASGGVSPYVSVAVRVHVLESGSSRIFGFRDACSWCRDIWHWIEAAVERRCLPRWTPWILAGGSSVMAGSFLAILWVIMDVVWIYSQLCSLTVPFFALMSGYLLLALGFRHSWTPTGIYLTFCGSIIGETPGFFLSSALDAQNVFFLMILHTTTPLLASCYPLRPVRDVILYHPTHRQDPTFWRIVQKMDGMPEEQKLLQLLLSI